MTHERYIELIKQCDEHGGVLLNSDELRAIINGYTRMRNTLSRWVKGFEFCNLAAKSEVQRLMIQETNLVLTLNEREEPA